LPVRIAGTYAATGFGAVGTLCPKLINLDRISLIS